MGEALMIRKSFSSRMILKESFCVSRPVAQFEPRGKTSNKNSFWSGEAGNKSQYSVVVSRLKRISKTPGEPENGTKPDCVSSIGASVSPSAFLTLANPLEAAEIEVETTFATFARKLRAST